MALSSTVRLQFAESGSSGENDITINGPRGDQAIDRPVHRWVGGHSAGGTPYTYKVSASAKRIWNLQFDFLTAAQWLDLQQFFDLVGPEEEFTYTHTDGNSYTARFVNTELLPTRVLPNLYSVPVQLEIGSHIT